MMPKEIARLHRVIRELVIGHRRVWGNDTGQMRCSLCSSVWTPGAAEIHKPGCDAHNVVMQRLRPDEIKEAGGDRNVCHNNHKYDEDGRPCYGPHEASGWFHLNPILRWVKHCKHCGCLFLVPEVKDEGEHQ